jgi:hypothetical protein
MSLHVTPIHLADFAQSILTLRSDREQLVDSSYIDSAMFSSASPARARCESSNILRAGHTLSR